MSASVRPGSSWPSTLHQLVVERKRFFQRGDFAGFLDAAQALDHAVSRLAIQAGASVGQIAGKGETDAVGLNANAAARSA